MQHVIIRRVSDPSPRERMIQSAMLLVGERGVEATSFSDVLEHSGAPRGSIYHHFPGGKAQLMEEATRFGGQLITTGLTAALEQADPVAAVEGIAGFWRSALRETNYAAGCPVVAATVEGGRLPGARDAAREAFTRWAELHAEILQRAGVEEARARSIGTLLVAAIEGAIVVARAERSQEPLDRVIDELQLVLAGAVGRDSG
jgi:AcrR family transcriptional regulator